MLTTEEREGGWQLKNDKQTLVLGQSPHFGSITSDEPSNGQRDCSKSPGINVTVEGTNAVEDIATVYLYLVPALLSIWALLFPLFFNDRNDLVTWLINC